MRLDVALTWRDVGATGGAKTEQRGEGRTITALDDVLARTIGRLGMAPALLLGAAIYAAIGLVLLGHRRLRAMS